MHYAILIGIFDAPLVIYFRCLWWCVYRNRQNRSCDSTSCCVWLYRAPFTIRTYASGCTSAIKGGTKTLNRWEI